MIQMKKREIVTWLVAIGIFVAGIISLYTCLHLFTQEDSSELVEVFVIEQLEIQPMNEGNQWFISIIFDVENKYSDDLSFPWYIL